MSCESCKGHETPQEAVSYVVYEGAVARGERREKRLIRLLCAAVAALVLCNLVWLWAWTSHDYVSSDIDYVQDGRGLNIIGDSNEVGEYGAATENTNTQP